MRAVGYPYAVYDRDGDMVYIGLHDNEEDCWKIYLGWPHLEEIADAKARGLKVVRVRVTDGLSQAAP